MLADVSWPSLSGRLDQAAVPATAALSEYADRSDETGGGKMCGGAAAMAYPALSTQVPTPMSGGLHCTASAHCSQCARAGSLANPSTVVVVVVAAAAVAAAVRGFTRCRPPLWRAFRPGLRSRPRDRAQPLPP